MSFQNTCAGMRISNRIIKSLYSRITTRHHFNFIRANQFLIVQSSNLFSLGSKNTCIYNNVLLKGYSTSTIPNIKDVEVEVDATSTSSVSVEKMSIRQPLIRNMNEVNSSRDLLKELPQYKNTFADCDQIINDEMLEKFKPQVKEFINMAKANGETTSISDPIFAEIVDSICSLVPTLTDEELKALIYSMSYFEISTRPKEEQFRKFWTALDNECMKRMKTWDWDSLFVVEDIWLKTRLSRYAYFTWNLLKKLFRKCDKLSVEHYIRFMNLINVSRKICDEISTYDLEFNLAKHIDKLSYKEAMSVAIGFFKSETPIRDKIILAKLLNTVMGKGPELSNYTIAALCKIARLSSNFSIADTLVKFQSELVPEIDRLSPTACTQLAIVGTRASVYHRDVIEKTMKKVEENLEDARIKDFERVLLAATMFSHDCTAFIMKVLEELKKPHRKSEMEEHGRCLSSILYYSSFKGIFDYDLINRALDPIACKKTYDGTNPDYQREVLCLDLSMDIECPDYTGNRLPEKLRFYLLKRLNFWLSTPTKGRVLEYEATVRTNQDAFAKILGNSELLYPCNILPQFRTAEIVICYDENNQIIKTPEKLRNIEEYKVKMIPDDPELKNITIKAFVICSRNTYIYNTRQLTGNVNLQIRQFKKLGYKVELIPWNVPQVDGENRRREFLTELLFNSKNN